MAISLKDTKNNIFKAYREAVNELKDLEKELKGKQEEAFELKTELLDCRNASGEPQVIIKAPEVNTMEGIIKTLKSVEQGIASAFSETSAQQVVEAEKLEDLRKKIELERIEIKKLYNVELADGTLFKLIEDYLQAQETFELHFNEKQKTYKAELELKNAEWQKEQEETALKMKERRFELELIKERDMEGYQYQLEQDRNLEEDAYGQKRKQLDLELEELSTQKNLEWNEREKLIANQESDFERYKVEFEGLDALLEKEQKKAEYEAKAIVEREHKVKMKLLETEVNSEQNALHLRIDDLRNVLEKQSVQIQKLYQQLEETQRQAQTLALKALEGSSSSDSYKAVREIAMEQAKNLGKNK